MTPETTHVDRPEPRGLASTFVRRLRDRVVTGRPLADVRAVAEDADRWANDPSVEPRSQGIYEAIAMIADAWCDDEVQHDRAAVRDHTLGRSQWPEILRLLADGPRTPSAISTALGLSPSTAVRRLAWLREEGMAEVWADWGTDGRLRAHRLTAAGRAAVVPAAARAEAVVVVVAGESNLPLTLTRLANDLPEVLHASERPVFHRAVATGLAARLLSEDHPAGAVARALVQTLSVLASARSPEQESAITSLEDGWRAVECRSPSEERTRQFAKLSLAAIAPGHLGSRARRCSEWSALLARASGEPPWMPVAAHLATEDAAAEHRSGQALLDIAEARLGELSSVGEPWLSAPCTHWRGVAHHRLGRSPRPVWSALFTPDQSEERLAESQQRVLREVRAESRLTLVWLDFSRRLCDYLLEGMPPTRGIDPVALREALEPRPIPERDSGVLRWVRANATRVDAELTRSLAAAPDPALTAMATAVTETVSEIRESMIGEGRDTALLATMAHRSAIAQRCVTPEEAPLRLLGDDDLDEVLALSRSTGARPLLTGWSHALASNQRRQAAAI